MSYQTAPLPSLPALLRRARRTYGEAMRSALVQEGYDDIPASGLYVIGSLALSEGGVPISWLVKELAISKQAAGQLVDTLVTRGYIKRATDEADRRQLIVTLTPRGVAAAKTQMIAREAIDATLLSMVGGSDLDKTRHTLSALIDIGRPSHKEDIADNRKQTTSDPATFDDRSLDDVMFRNCAMARAGFDDVRLADARFANVDLQRASFKNVNLTNVVIEDANIAGLTVMGHDVSTIIRHLTGVQGVESERMADSVATDTMPEQPTVGAFAIVPSNDLSAAVPFWERLGFGRRGEDDNYIIMTGWDCEVHLTQAGRGPWRVAAENNPFGVFIRTPNVAAIAAKVDDLIIRPGGILRHREWGLYEVGIAGPDGLLVRVGWPSRLLPP